MSEPMEVCAICEREVDPTQEEVYTCRGCGRTICYDCMDKNGQCDDCEREYRASHGEIF